VAGDGSGPLHAAWAWAVLARAGLVWPERPDRALRALLAMRRRPAGPGAFLEIGAIRCPRRRAIVDDEGAIAYAELDALAAAVARGLRSEGLARPARLGILCRNHRWFAAALAAAEGLGIDCVLLNTEFGAPAVGDVIERHGVGRLVVDPDLAETARAAAPDVPRFVAGSEGDGSLGQLAGRHAGGARPEPEADARVVLLTSGTTGAPRGAERPAPRSVAPGASIVSRLPLRARTTSVVGPPLFHAWGFAHLTLGLGLACTSVLRRRFDAGAAVADVREHGARCLVVVPVMLRRVLDALAPDERLPTLRVVACGGAPLSPALAAEAMDRLGEVVYDFYGSTEAAWATIATPRDLRAAPGTVGRPPRGTVVEIRGPGGERLPPGAVGRIAVRNSFGFEGYTGGGAGRRVGELVATGDVGRFDEEGRLFVTGREDEMIVSGGENVFPGEVEDALVEHPSLCDAAVVGVPDDEFGQRLRAYVVRAAGADVGADDVRAYVRERLARFKVPREVVFVGELPRTASGKVVKRALDAS
jgi:acyl-CoA synthetase (AMP-forming)/AMP-acid ligase II